MRNLGLLLFFMLLYFSCNPKNEGVSKDELVAENTEQTTSVDLENPKVPGNRKIIWNADLEFQVKDVDKSTKDITKLCSKYNAFISHMNLTSSNYSVSNKITIRVDNEKFNALINEIKGTSTFIRKVEIKSNDVTEEFVDINSRLKTKKEVRERYIEILRNRSGEIKDVIAAEDAIRKITEEIEAKEGRLRYLQDKVSQSTIDLEIYQKVDFKSEPETFEKGFFTKAKESIETGWNMIVEIFVFMLKIWPLILLVIIVFFWRRKWYNKNSIK